MNGMAVPVDRARKIRAGLAVSDHAFRPASRILLSFVSGRVICPEGV